MGIIKEFTDFAVKGNALDLAVGVIIGAAFGKVVNSIVSDLFLPPLGWLIGGVHSTELQWVIAPAVAATETAPAKAAVAIRYGAFIDTVVQFLIVAIAVFVAIKAMTQVASLRSLEDLKRIAELGDKKS